jgi:uncharacterized protein (UPF0332 family)
MSTLYPDSFTALLRAKEAIEAAEFDIQGRFYRAAANRAYYGCYYCMVALLLTENVYAKTHQGIRAKFTELFIKTNRLPESIAGSIRNAFELRQEADYDLDAVIPPDIVRELVRTTWKVYEASADYLQKLKEK